jgi:hypothetical protein
MNEPGKRNKIDKSAVAAESSASEHSGLSPELQAIEAEWARLRPRTDRIDRDRLMFLAGQASVAEQAELPRSSRLRVWFWPTSFAGMTAVAAVLFAMVFMRPEPQLVERIVYAAPGSAADERNARPVVGRGAAVGTASASRESAAPGTWTAGMAFHLGDDLLALAPAGELGTTTPAAGATDDQPILSRRSLRALLDRDECASPDERRTNNVQPAGVKL